MRVPVVVLPFTTAGRFQVLGRVFLEGCLAAGGAEVIGLPPVLGLGRRLFWVHLHLAYWIDRHVTHLPISVFTHIVSQRQDNGERNLARFPPRHLAEVTPLEQRSPT
jgi:hypothetical protein